MVPPDEDRGGADDAPTTADDDRGDVGDTPTTTGDRLLADAMLGTLTTYLRMCGYDAAYAPDRGAEADDEVLALAAREDRRIVTRDRQLAARAPGSVLVGSRAVLDQLRELRDAGFEIALADRPTRCGRCNGPLRPTETTTLPEYVSDDAEEVWRCAECGQFFWRGSHWDDVRRRLDDL
ncbi:MAG: Mut7-C RNAse domain-containing protein [Salinigranum sp.]